MYVCVGQKWYFFPFLVSRFAVMLAFKIYAEIYNYPSLV